MLPSEKAIYEKPAAQFNEQWGGSAASVQCTESSERCLAKDAG
jgi:hypothetical protein